MNDYLSEAEEPEIPDGPAGAKIIPWLRCNLPVWFLGMLTGTDKDALEAAAGLLTLYQRTRNPEVLAGFKTCVLVMQPKAREMAYHAIAHVAEWETREQWWGRAGLWEHSSFTADNVVPCKYAPEGKEFRR